MLAIAIAIVIVACVAAMAYAAPKFYWYRMQSQLILRQADDERDRFAALKESHDLGALVVESPGPMKPSPDNITPGQYL